MDLLPDFSVESLVLVGGSGISNPSTGRQIFRHRGFVLLPGELWAVIVNVEHRDTYDSGASQWRRACKRVKEEIQIKIPPFLRLYSIKNLILKIDIWLTSEKFFYNIIDDFFPICV